MKHTYRIISATTPTIKGVFSATVHETTLKGWFKSPVTIERKVEGIFIDDLLRYSHFIDTSEDTPDNLNSALMVYLLSQ